jgi:hypothetical protein
MPAIPKTVLDTGRTLGSIDLCKGFALYPMGTLRAGFHAERKTLPTFQAGPQVLGLALDVVLGLGFYAGICGPAYATEITVEGTADANDIDLTTSNSHTTAGFEAGLGLILDIEVRLRRWVVDVHFKGSGWEKKLVDDSHWANVGSVKLQKEVDLITILIDYVLGQKYPKSDLSVPSGGALSAIERSEDLGKLGRVTLRPEFYMIIDIAKLIPDPTWQGFLESWKLLGGTLDVGPTVNLTLPVTVTTKKVRTDGVEYDVAPPWSGGPNKLSGPKLAPSTVPASTIEIELEHKSSVEFGFGVGFEITFIKVFSIGWHSPAINIIGLVGLPIGVHAPMTNSISAAYGAAGAAPFGVEHPGEHSESEYQVIFEDAVA